MKKQKKPTKDNRIVLTIKEEADNAHGGQKGAATGDGAAGFGSETQVVTRPAPVDEEHGA